MKLRTRLMHINLALIVVAMVSIVGYLLYVHYSTSSDMAIREVQLTTETVAKDMEAELGDIIEGTEKFADTMELLIQSNSKDRSLVMNYMKDELRFNEKYVDAWAIFEPNAFDGNDILHRHKSGSNETGRFVPLITRDGEKLLEDHCKHIDGNA